MPRILKWNVTGMTCTSCEKLIGNVLQDYPGVVEVEVSIKKAKAAVRMRDDAPDPDLDLLNRQLQAHGYVLSPESCAMPTVARPLLPRVRRAISAVVVVGLALIILSPLRTLVPSVAAGASVGALFLLGIVASLSSCLATTGGFMLAYTAQATSRRKTILMHIGRLGAFVLGGALLGLLGGALPTESAGWYGAFAVILGIGIFAVALNLLELSPSLARFGIALPSSLHRFAERVRSRPGAITPVLVGAVTFVLPCGFTQTAQALALASGSPLKGMAYMTAFAVGTLPVLLGVTALAAKATLQHQFLRACMGAIMVFFAVAQIQSGLTVLGFTPSISLPQETARAAQPDGEVQVIKMDVLSSGYSPDTFTIRKGIPVRWEINGVSVGGCTNAIVSRQLGISQRLQPGLNVINFTPQTTGKIAFSCSMGMVRGSFTVVEKTS